MSTISTPATSTALARISVARQALAEARTMDEVLDVRNKAAAIQNYMSMIGESLEVQNHAAYIKLSAERKAGELLAGMEKHNGDPRSHDGTRLSALGINKNQSSRWQLEAEVPEDRFLQLVHECQEDQLELTQSKLLKLANGAHVGESGCNEWYTPALYIEAARVVMDGIDLDPATSNEAQELVQAETFYTIADDGLAQNWEGSVWMNPPYSRDLIERFCQKLVDSYRKGSVDSAIVLVNNATETGAGQLLLSSCDAVCFHRGRIKFHGPKAQKNSPLQGQMFSYFGKFANVFGEEFARFGSCR